MTTSLHAHMSTASRDCDGPMYRDYVEALNDDERAEHERANGVNDFHDLNFKARILAGAVFFSAEFGATVNITPEGFTYNEPTDEGHRSVEVRWCEDESCDPNAYTQRDVYAEMMGY